MNLHYSLYPLTVHSALQSIIDLSTVVSVYKFPLSDFYSIATSTPELDFSVHAKDFDHFLAAWNRYKYAAAAAKLIKTPEITNPNIACNSAMRIDEYLGFLAGEKLKELAELADQKAA